MAIPHLIFKQKAKRRLIGKEGKEKIEEIKKLISEMPGYKTGPYGEIRKWLNEEIQLARIKKGVKHKDVFAVKKEGDVQIAVVGAPNAGKSSLLNAFSGVQIKIAPYIFTTVKPSAAIVNINGANVQLVEIPGLVEGAKEGRGKGRALISAAMAADFIILLHSLETGAEDLRRVLNELGEKGIAKIAMMVCNKSDLPQADNNLSLIKRAFPNYQILAISTAKKLGLDNLKNEIWKLLKLMRVFSKDQDDVVAGKPFLLPVGSAIKDFCENMHSEAVDKFKYAKIWGPSSKFPGQQVGLSHILRDRDVVQLHI